MVALTPFIACVLFLFIGVAFLLNAYKTLRLQADDSWLFLRVVCLAGFGIGLCMIGGFFLFALTVRFLT